MKAQETMIKEIAKLNVEWERELAGLKDVLTNKQKELPDGAIIEVIEDYLEQLKYIDISRSTLKFTLEEIE